MRFQEIAKKRSWNIRTKTGRNEIPKKYSRNRQDCNKTLEITVQTFTSNNKIIIRQFIRRRGSMQMSMRKLNSHTILQLWCCCHVMYKLLYPSIRVMTAPPVSVTVRVRVSVSFGVTPLRILICMCPRRRNMSESP